MITITRYKDIELKFLIMFHDRTRITHGAVFYFNP